jgi:hypothetical protein
MEIAGLPIWDLALAMEYIGVALVWPGVVNHATVDDVMNTLPPPPLNQGGH